MSDTLSGSDKDLITRVREHRHRGEYEALLSLCEGLESPSSALLEECAIACWRTGRKEESRAWYVRLIESYYNEESLPSPLYHRLQQGCASYPPYSGPTILISCHCHPLLPCWSPFSIKGGISGSEEAVIYAAQELARRQYRVIVAASPPINSPYSLAHSNPRYTDASTASDIAIAWRHTDFLALKKSAKTVLFWPHDPPTYQFSTDGLDGVLFLSEHQRQDYYRHAPTLRDLPYVVCGNGIDPTQFQATSEKRDPYACIYASNYARGLDILLKVWPRVRAEFPSASLDIYYGRETWGSLSPDQLQEIVQRIDSLTSSGVTERGKVGHLQLASAMMKASLFTYPCTCSAETFCITAVKAQAAGLIPVTSRIAALAETVHPDAPALPPPVQEEEYLQLLLSTMRSVPGEEQREIYRRFAFRFTWSACIDLWVHLFSRFSP